MSERAVGRAQAGERAVGQSGAVQEGSRAAATADGACGALCLCRALCFVR